MKNVYLEKRGKFYGIKFLNADGKWTHNSLGTKKAAVAKRKMQRFIDQMEKRELLGEYGIVPITFKDLCMKFLAYMKAKKSAGYHGTVSYYVDKRYLPHFGEKTLTTAVTPYDIEQFAIDRKNKSDIKNATVNRELAALRHMFRMAEEWGHVALSPGRRVRLLVDDGTVRTRYLTRAEILKLVSTADENRKTRQFGFSSLHFTDWPEWIILNSNTGLRRREMLFLEFTDVDWNACVLHIRRKPDLKFHPKSHQERRIPINEPAMSALRSLFAKKHPESDFVFQKTDGSPWKNVGGSFENLVKQCGLKAVTLHTMRHTFGAQLAQAGIDMKRIKESTTHYPSPGLSRIRHDNSATSPI